MRDLYKRLISVCGLVAIECQGVSYTDEAIINAMSADMVAVAVGAENHTLGSETLTFDMWLLLSRDNWMPEVQKQLPGIREHDIEAALRRYVAVHRDESFMTVLRQEETRRGLSASTVIMPGESTEMQVEMQVK